MGRQDALRTSDPCSGPTTMVAPRVRLRALFVLDSRGRIISSREPDPPSAAPLFALIRSATSCAWAIRVDVLDDKAAELDRLAREEHPVSDFRLPSLHAERYISLVGGKVSAGPAFAFPKQLDEPTDIQVIDDEEPLLHHFRGWTPGEITEARAPVMAIVEDCYPVSICFCSRRTDEAAEAGLETAEAYRGRGYGPHVTRAWALAVRASGRVPIYSTTWDNTASLAVARKLGLVACASDWSLVDSLNH